jgi:hypothetical protein
MLDRLYLMGEREPVADGMPYPACEKVSRLRSANRRIRLYCGANKEGLLFLSGKLVYTQFRQRKLCCTGEVRPSLPLYLVCMLSALTVDCLESLVVSRHVKRAINGRVYTWSIHCVHSTRSALMICQHCHSNALQYKPIRHTHSSLLSSSPSDRLDDVLGVAGLCM